MRGGTLASILFRMPFFYFNTFNKETMKKTSNKLNKKNIKGIIKQVKWIINNSSIEVQKSKVTKALRCNTERSL